MMRIPSEFAAILSENEKLNSIVIKAVSDFSDIIKHSQFEFFPEYTDHKLDHLNKVLDTAFYLVKDSGLDLLTPEDICTIVLSTLLHDIGMHLTYEGFLSLIEDKYAGGIIHEFDNFSWASLWDLYIKELRKLSSKSLINLFGQEFEVKELPRNKDLLTRLDRKIIGEFIRRHHPRLAHEVAMFGYPTKNNLVMEFAQGLEEGLKDIVGVVARSHGMDIRDTFSYLERKYYKAWRNPRNVKCIYIMVVLRISDYLHITSDRTPQVYLNTNNISSTISNLEWNLHKSVKEINYELPDKETLFVIAEPNDSLKFLKLKKRFKDIQLELDTSWAVLGEVYSYVDNYKNLGIKIRRIQSNLDNLIEFSSNVSYLPREVRCESSPDLIKLLIAPLYGDDPSYGFRELLQNSIDACRERRICEDRTDSDYKPEIKIDICIQDDVKYFKIKDNGIGMSEDVIVNYFLKAGSSFRDSHHWREQFLEDNGKSIVQRSGRFGVGVYAGFLIGENIKVTTRHLESERSFEFNINLTEEQIEVNVNTSIQDIGTEIIIEITDSILNILKKQLKSGSSYMEIAWFDWYKLSDVKIQICIPDEWKNYEDKINNISKIEKNDIDQHELLVEDYNEVRWTYNKSIFSDYSKHNLVCNGIVIPDGYTLNGYDFPTFFNTREPLLLVSDYDGHLPLSLSRDKIYKKLPFKKELLSDISKDILAAQLMLPTLEFNSYGNFRIINSYLRHNSLCHESYNFPIIEEVDLIFLREGFCLVHSYNIDKLGLEKINKIWLKDLEDNFLNGEDNLNGIIFTDKKPNSISAFREIIDNKYLSVDKHYIIRGKRIIVNRERYRYLLEKDRMRSSFKKEVVEKKVGKNVVWLEIGETDVSNFDFELFDKNFDKYNVYCEYFLGPKVKSDVVDRYKRYPREELEDVFSTILEEVFDNKVLIPYDSHSRKSMQYEAYNILTKYIQKYK